MFTIKDLPVSAKTFSKSKKKPLNSNKIITCSPLFGYLYFLKECILILVK